MEATLKYRSRIIIEAYKDWVPSSAKVLDVGCGNAIVTEELKKGLGCSMIGTDIMDYRKRDIPFKIMAEENRLPFETQEFDICMLNDTLHHCSNPERLLEESGRVAKRVLLFEMEPTLAARLADLVVNKFHNSRMNKVLNVMAPHQWEDYFKKLNFNFEYRRIKKPAFLYPFSNFAFNLKRS